MPQPLNLTDGGSGTLFVRHQTHTLLHACPGGVVLKVEQVLCVPSQRSHPGVEVRALKVGHGRKTLLPYGVLLISDPEKHDRQCGSNGEAVLAQRGESDVRHHLNAGVGLAADDRPQPWLHRVKVYHHTNLAHVQVVVPGQSAMVDWSIPVVAQTDECIVYHSREPQAMLACGTQFPIVGEVEVGVIVQLHLKRIYKNVTNPMPIAQQVNTEICIKANSSK
jgi:hypothetical protein